MVLWFWLEYVLDEIKALKKQLAIYEKQIEQLTLKVNKYEGRRVPVLRPLLVDATPEDNMKIPMNEIWNLPDRTAVANAFKIAGIEVEKVTADISCKENAVRRGEVNAVTIGQLSRLIEYYDRIYITTRNLTFKSSRDYYINKKNELILHIKEKQCTAKQ